MYAHYILGIIWPIIFTECWILGDRVLEQGGVSLFDLSWLEGNDFTEESHFENNLIRNWKVLLHITCILKSD